MPPDRVAGDGGSGRTKGRGEEVDDRLVAPPAVATPVWDRPVVLGEGSHGDGGQGERGLRLELLRDSVARPEGDRPVVLTGGRLTDEQRERHPEVEGVHPA